jgi:hypothetical protein
MEVVAVIVVINNNDENNNDSNVVDGGGDDGDIRCEAFITAAEGIKSQVTSCVNLEQTPLF